MLSNEIICNDFPFENLVIEGGGVKAISYIGAFNAFYDFGVVPCFKRIIGTSAGSIFGTIFATKPSKSVLKIFEKKQSSPIAMGSNRKPWQ